MGILETAKLVLGLLPTILEAVKAVEAALPISGKGKEKLELVKTSVQAVFDASNQTVTTFQETWPQLEKVVSAVVTLFNSVGLFKKK